MKTTFKVLSFLIIFIILGCGQKPNHVNDSTVKYKTTGSIERLDPAIDDLISQNAAIEILADGHSWTEGPLWLSDEKTLLYSDIPANSIFKWSEKEGKTLYLKPSGYTEADKRGGELGSNALILDRLGNLVLCQHGDRRIAKMQAKINAPKANFETIVGQYEDKRFNSPNDAVYDNEGNLFFTDPPYGLEKNAEDPKKEISFQGVYRYSHDGQLSLISDKMSRPNGIGLSPDEKTLYVSNSQYPPNWMAFDLNEDGTVANESLFASANYEDGKGAPDGLKVDQAGNIWATGPGGVWVFNSSGKALGRILTGEATSNCAFTEDESILYMTCDQYLMRIKLK